MFLLLTNKKIYLQEHLELNQGKIIPLDGGIYDLDKEVVKSEKWSNPEKGIKNGLTVIVNGGWV